MDPDSTKKARAERRLRPHLSMSLVGQQPAASDVTGSISEQQSWGCQEMWNPKNPMADVVPQEIIN